MSKKVIIELTEKEAEELLSVAGNGWGEGNFYGLNDGEGGNNGSILNHAALFFLFSSLSFLILFLRER